jgi:hypothetical protein
VSQNLMKSPWCVPYEFYISKATWCVSITRFYVFLCKGGIPSFYIFLALMQIVIWFPFRHNRTFIMQLSSSEMINDERDFISKKSHPS